MGRDVVIALEETSVRRAAAAMSERDIGSVVVVDSMGPCGVFTERDLLTRVLCRGRDPDSTVLAEVTSPAFPSIDGERSLEEAAERMLQVKSRMMVFEGPDLVGIVTATDLVREVGSAEVDFEVQGSVSTDLVTLPAEAPIEVAVRVMEEKRVGSVLVGDEMWPEAIFTERDALKRVVMGRRGPSTQLSEVSSSPLVTSGLGVLGREAARIMTGNGIKRLPLTYGGEVKGVLTARDLVESFASSRRKPCPRRVDWTQWN
jgi:CBS domain-containing protein